jgi:hypothetical protein
MDLHVEVDKNCGCLAISEESIELRPGESRRLTIDVRVPRVGRRTMAVTLWTNDPTNSTERLLITTHGSTKPPVILSSSSQRIAFRDVLRSGATRNIRIVTLEEPGSVNWLRDAIASDEHFVLSDVSVQQASNDAEPDSGVVERIYEWSINLAKLPDERHFEGRIDILADEGAGPVQSYVVSVERIENYQVTPTSLVITDSGRTPFPVSRKILVSAHSAEETFTVTAAETDSQWLEASVLSSQGRTRVIEVQARTRPSESFKKAIVEISIEGAETIKRSVPIVYNRIPSEH